MTFKIIPKVPGIRIVYDVSTISAASSIRNALGRLTGNNREVLVIQMGPNTSNCSDVTLHLFETNKEIRIEDLSSKPRHAKLFCPEKLSKDAAESIAAYVLTSYEIVVSKNTD